MLRWKAFYTRTGGSVLRERLRIDATGNVGIGTTSPPYKLVVDNAGSAGIVAGFENSSGECTINPTGSSVNCSSDASLKKNITSMDASSTLADVLALNPVYFSWNQEQDGAPQHSGFIAQDVQPLFPDLVSTGSNGKLLLNYAGFTVYIVKAMQELSAKVATMTATAGSAATEVLDAILASHIVVTNLEAVDIHTQKLHADQLCSGDICVDVKTLIEKAGANAVGPSRFSSAEQPQRATTTPDAAPNVDALSPPPPAPETSAATTTP